MTSTRRDLLKELLQDAPGARLTVVLQAVGVARSSWYRSPKEERGRPGPAPQKIASETSSAVVQMATANPWYGYKRIAVMCRREGQAVTNRQAYRVMREYGLLQKRRPRGPELHQASKLYELLPSGPNELWQTYYARSA